MSKTPPTGDHPSRHPLSHHSDHSGAHVRGTHHHERNAHNPHDGLTASERGGSDQSGGGTESGDSTGFSKRGGEGKADMHLSEHPTKMELPALSHNRADQE